MSQLIIISCLTLASLGLIWVYSDQIKSVLGFKKDVKPDVKTEEKKDVNTGEKKDVNTGEKKEVKPEEKKDVKTNDKKDHNLENNIAPKKQDDDLIMMKTHVQSDFKQFCCRLPSKFSLVLETIYNSNLSYYANSNKKYGFFNKPGLQQLIYPMSDYDSDQNKTYSDLFNQVANFNVLNLHFDKLDIHKNGFFTDLWSNAKLNDSDYKYDSSQLIQSLVKEITKQYKTFQTDNAFIVFLQQSLVNSELKLKLYPESVEVDNVSYQLTAFNIKNKEHDALVLVKNGDYIVFDNYCRNNIQNESKYFPQNDRSVLNAIGSVTGQFVKIIKLIDVNYLIISVTGVRV